MARADKTAQIIVGDAADLSQAGNPYVFRTNVSQTTAMPKLVKLVATSLKVRKIAIPCVNNDFGKGGRDTFIKPAKLCGLEIVADAPTEQGQNDFASDVVKIVRSGADAALIYPNEDEAPVN